MQQKYDMLAEHLGDHLWARSSLDLDLLKEYPEFRFEGICYRVLFLDPQEAVNESLMEGKSFSKSLVGLDSYIANVEEFNPGITKEKRMVKLRSQVEGFDVQAALVFFKKNRGLTKETIGCFLPEEEVISFFVGSFDIIQ